MVSSHPTHNDHSMIIMILIIFWIERCPSQASLLGLCVYFMVGQKPSGLFPCCRISLKLFHHRQLVVKLTLYLNLDQSLTFYGSRFCCVAFMFRSEKNFSFGGLGFIDRDTRGSSCISEFLQQQNCLNWSWKSLMLMKGDQRVKQETCRIFVSVKIWGIKATANFTSGFHNIFKLIEHKW